jgi:3-(3-hydroxy-phenyl)propionate hydroxylase
MGGGYLRGVGGVVAGGQLPYDVLVVGYGPVGAVLAARLGALGVSALVVEREPDAYPLPRAVAADDEVQELLERSVPGVLDGALSDRAVRFVDAARRHVGELRFPTGTGGRPGLVLFSQPTVERRLRTHVASLPAVEVRLGTALVGWDQDEAAVTARLSDGDLVRARWMVGCDGASSFVRRSAGLAWRGRDLPRDWLLVDVEGTVPGRDRFTYTCDPARPQVDMPLPGGHRWEWLLAPGEPAPPVEPLLARDADPASVRVVRALTYRYGARRAATWRSGRVLLAGDAAHTMPPFAGQGLGAGVRDAWALAAMLAADDPAGYQALREPHVVRMTRLSLFLGAVVETRSPPAAALRDALLRAAFRAPALGPWLSRGGPRNSRSGVLATARPRSS